jgi:hypothetical protein
MLPPTRILHFNKLFQRDVTTDSVPVFVNLPGRLLVLADLADLARTAGMKAAARGDVHGTRDIST